MATPIIDAAIPDGNGPDNIWNVARRLEESHVRLLEALKQTDILNTPDRLYNQSEFAASVRKIIAAAEEIK